MKNTNSNFISSSFGLSWLRASLNVAAFACASLLVITSLADAGGAQGARVRRGNVSFSQDGNRLIVRASNGAIIEYDRLSIEAGQIMQFIQPSATSRVLNRVTGSELTRIDGTLLSNGIVYLINPQGFRIGNGAVIKVGGFFAAAGAMSNNDFLAGRDRFTNLTGQVTNEGLIQAQAVALVGQYVANRGTIDVGNGYLAMGAGDSVVIQKGTGPVMVTVSRSQLGADGSGSGTQAAISNTGTINAGKGSVSMASGDFYALAMDLSGSIIGKSIAARGGKDGVVAVNGTLDASSSTGKGGTIDVFGDRVGLFGNALVNANGATGGGSVRIGGDYLGTNAANAPQANRTFIGSDARITANATQSGDGGRVIVWSNEYTGFFGSIEASAAGSGKGGFIETSSKDNLQAFGHVDASSALGQAGTWLLDPADLTISSAANTAGGTGTAVDPFAPLANSSVLNTITLQTALQLGDVTIQTDITVGTPAQTGTITFANWLTPTLIAATTLTVNSVGDIVVSAGVTFSANAFALNLILVADATGGGTGSITFNDNIDNNGGSLSLNAAGAITFNGNVGTAINPLGDITVVTATDATFNGTVDAASFDQIAGSGTTAFNDVITFGGAFGFTGTNLQMNGVGTNSADTIQIIQSGVFTLAEDANIDVTNPGGHFYSGGSGTNIIAGNITADVYIEFDGDVELAGADAVVLTMTNGLGGNLLFFGGNITGSGQDLTLDSNTQIRVAGNIGTLLAPLGDIIVTNATNATFEGTVDAASFTQIAGSGITAFNDVITFGGAFDFTGTNLEMNGVGTNFADTIDINQSGVFTLAEDANIQVTNLGGYFYSGVAGTNIIAGNITAYQYIQFDGDVELAGADAVVLTMTNGGGGNTLYFAGNITGSGQDLTLDSNTQIQVDGNIGTALNPLGDIIITNATNATFDGTVDAASFTQNAGSGTTAFNDVITFSGAFDFTGTDLEMNGVGNNFADRIDIFQSGIFTLADGANIEVTNVGGYFSSVGAGTNTIAGNITAYQYIEFEGGDVQLAGADAVVLTMTSGGSFNSLYFDGNITGSGQDLTLNSNTQIQVNGSIGTLLAPLGDIIVTNATNATFNGTVDAASFTQIAGSGITAFNDVITFGGAFDFTGTDLEMNGVGTNVADTIDINQSGIFTLADGANIEVTNVGGYFSSGAAGTNIIAGNITADLYIAFVGDVELAGADAVVLTMTNGGGGNTLYFDGNITGNGQDLTLDSNTNILVAGNIGTLGAPLGDIIVTNATNATFDGTVDAASFTQIAGSDTTTFNDGLTIGLGGLDITTDTIVVNAPADITSLGAVSLVADGLGIDSGDLTVFGDIQSDSTIDLDGFEGVFMSGSTIDAATTLTINSDNDVVSMLLSTSITATDVVITTLNGNVEQDDTSSIFTSTLDVNAAGFDVILGDTTSFHTNELGTVTVVANNVELDSNTIIFDTSNVNDLTVQTTDAAGITQVALSTLTVNGTTYLDALAITLDLLNDFVGEVLIINGDTVTLNDINDFTFGNGNSSQMESLVLTADGLISQSEAVTVFSSADISTTAGNNIVLTDVSNQFNGTVSVVGDNVAISSVVDLEMGLSNVAGNLDLVSSGNITQSDVLNVTGATTLDVTTLGSDILLSTESNFLDGGVTILTAGNVRDFKLNNQSLTAAAVVNLTNALATNLRDLTINYAVAYVVPNLTMATLNNIDITAAGITQGAGGVDNSGGLTGTVNLVSLGSDITMTDANNVMEGVITMDSRAVLSGNGGNIDFSTSTSLTINTVHADGMGTSGANGGSITLLAAGGTLGDDFTLQASGVISSTGASNAAGSGGDGGQILLEALSLGQVFFGANSLVSTEGGDAIGGNGGDGAFIQVYSNFFDPANGLITIGSGSTFSSSGGDSTSGTGGNGGTLIGVIYEGMEFYAPTIQGINLTFTAAGGTGPVSNGNLGTITFYGTTWSGDFTFVGNYNAGNVIVTGVPGGTYIIDGNGELTINTLTTPGINLTLDVGDLVLTGLWLNTNVLPVTLTVTAFNDASNIGLGDTFGGGFTAGIQLDSAELAFLDNSNGGISTLALGDSFWTGDAALTAGSTVPFNLNITQNLGGGGDVFFGTYANGSGAGNITVDGFVTVIDSGDTTYLAGLNVIAGGSFAGSYEFNGSQCTVQATTFGIILNTTGFAAGFSAPSNANVVLRTMAAGQTISLTGTFTDSSGDFINNLTLTGNGANPAITAISASGTITGALIIARSTGFSLGTVSSAGTILAASSVQVSAGIATTLTNNASLATNLATNGNIFFGGLLNGTFALALTAGSGDITFTGAAGGVNPLGAVTIADANNVTMVAFTAASLRQTETGTGTFTNNGLLTASAAGGVTIDSTNVAINGNILASFAGADVSVTGITTLAGDVTTNAGDVTFASATTLGGGATRTITTGGAAGDIRFGSTLDGGQNLALTAGTGNITFTGAVGFGNRLGAITVSSATNVSVGTVLVPAAMRAASFTQSAGTGTTLFSSTADLTNQFAFTGNNLTMNGVGSNVVGTTMTVTNSGFFTTANGVNISTGGAFATFSLTGLNSLGGNITTTDDTISFESVVTLTNGILMNTVSVGGGNNILFSGLIDGAQSLGLTAGIGDITFNGVVNGLGAVTVTSGATVLASQTFSAASFTQGAGTVATTFTGLVTLGGAFNFTGQALNINNDAAIGTTMTVNNAGLFTTANASNITAVGGLTQIGAGANSLGGNITTTNSVISFLRGVTLTSGISLNTGAGAGNILFSSTLDGAQTLGLLAGTGSINFAGAVGTANALGSVAVVSATNVDFNSSFAASSFTQAAGTGATTFNGLVNLAGAFNFTGNNLTMNGLVTTGGDFNFNTGNNLIMNERVTIGQLFNFTGNNLTMRGLGSNTITRQMDVLNTGLFTTANGTNITAGDYFRSNLSSLGGNITTTAIGGGGMTFTGGVTLTNSILMNSSAINGSISFNSTLNGGQSLGLTAGGGSIFFVGAVGALNPLGAVTVTSALTVLASSTFTAASFTQSAGLATTTFNGLVNLDGAFNFTGNNLIMNGLVTTGNTFNFNGAALNMNGSGWNVIGDRMIVTNTGSFTTAVGSNLNVTNRFTQLGAGSNSIGGNISSINSEISFNSAVTLTNDVTMRTGQNTGDFLFFGGTLGGNQTLGLTAGIGDITFNGVVNGLGAVTVTSGATVLASQTFSAASFTQGAGTVATTFTGLVTLGGAFNFTGQALNINNGAAIGTTMTVNNAGLFTTANASNITAVGGLTQIGAGANSLGGNITTTNSVISFLRGVTLTSGISLNTGAAGAGDINFLSTLTGTAPGAQALNLTSGTGNITFTGIVGTVALGGVTINAATNVTMLAAFTAASLNQSSVGSGTFTNNGLLTATAVGGVTINSTNVAINNNIVASFAGAAVSVTGITTLAGDVTTNEGNVTFASATTLSGGARTITTGTGAAGNILFSSTLNGLQTLNLTAGTGNINFTGVVGAVNALGAVTINSAASVTMSAFNAASLNQAVAGTGTFTNTGLLTAITGGVTINSLNVVIGNNIAANGSGQAVLVTGTTSLGGNVSTFGGNVTFFSPTTLTGAARTITTGTGAGNILFGSTLTGTAPGAQALNLTAADGNITFTGAVGAARLGAITITSARDVTASSSITASSLQQVAGTGTTTFNGAQDYNAAGGLNVVTGGTIRLNNTVLTTAGGVRLVGGTALVISNLGNITSFADVNFGELNNQGPIQTAGDVTTTGALAGVTYWAATTLSGVVILDTNSVALSGGTIEFRSTLDSTFGSFWGLDMDAGTGPSANINFWGAIGAGNRLGDIVVNSASNVAVGADNSTARMIAQSFQQFAGTGTTTFGEPTTASTFDLGSFGFIGNNLVLNGVGENVTGVMLVTNSGQFTTANGVNITATNGFFQANNGGTGTNSLGGNITTVDAEISFDNAVTLTSGILMNTVSVGGGSDITFGSTLDGPQSLGLTAGLGDIAFDDAVGTTARLGAITITSADDVTAGAITAASFRQVAGDASGVTRFDGPQNYNTIAGMNVVTGGSIVLNGAVTTTANGAVTLTGTTLLTITAAGSISSDGEVNFTSDVGGIFTAGNVTTSGDNVNYRNNTTLTGSIQIVTGSGLPGDINFQRTLDGDATTPAVENLTLSSGTGNINFTGVVGGGNRLGAVGVVSAASVVASQAFTAVSFEQVAGSVATTFNGLVNLTSLFDFFGTALTINGLGNNLIGTIVSPTGNMFVNNAGLFTLRDGANLVIGTATTGRFTQLSTAGTGNNLIGGNITTGVNIDFGRQVTLHGVDAVVLTAGTVITLTGNIFGVAQGLTMSAGTNILVSGNMGAPDNGALGAIRITTANISTYQGTINALSLTQVTGNGTTTFNGAQQYNGTDGLNVRSAGITLNNTVTTMAVRVGGTVDLFAETGFLTIAAGANISSDGIVNLTGFTGILTSGNVLTTGKDVNYRSPTTLRAGITVSTGNFVDADGDITFFSTLNGIATNAQTLGLTAGTGNITFTGAVGGLPLGGIRLGAVTVTSGATVLASSTFTAASFEQAAGSVATSFNGIVTLTNQFDFTGRALNINAVGANVVGTTMEVTNLGLFTTASGADITTNLATTGTFIQNGLGLNSLGGDVTTNNSLISYDTGVTLTEGILLNTGAGPGDIFFGSTLSGNQKLGLTAGAGNITFTGAVGGVTPLFTTRLGAVTVSSGATVFAASTFTAESFTQNAGSDATTFTGLVNLTNQFVFTGNNLTFNGVGNNTIGSSSPGSNFMDIRNSGTFTTAVGANLVVNQQLDQFGTGLNSIGGNITSTNRFINFDSRVELTNDVVMTSGLLGGDDITFGSTLDGFFDLTLTAGVVDPVTFASTGGDVYFEDNVGTGEALASLTVTSADSSTHFFADVTTVGDQLYTGGASIDGDATFTATDTLANITFNGAINNGAFVPSNMTVNAGGNVIFNGNIGAVSALGTFSANSGNDLGETITFGELGSGFFDQTANFEVWAESVQLNTGVTSTRSAPATMATIASQSDVGITFITDEFGMVQNHKLTSYGEIQIVGLTLPSATIVNLGDVNAVGNFTVVSDAINMIARSGGPILTNTGGTINDPLVDVVVGGQVFFSTTPGMIGGGKRAAFSNPTGNVDGWGTLGGFAKTVFRSAINRSLLTGLGGEVLDLSASNGVSYTNPATLVPSPMPILPAIGILGNSDTLDEAKDKEKAKAVEDSTKKTASESNPEPTGIPVASR